MIRIFTLTALLLFTIPCFGADLPILPNAPFTEGFGITTTAGSGPSRASADVTICIVDNLDDDGSSETDQTDREVTGSLRYCLEDLDPVGTGKVVVFATSGTIELATPIKIAGNLGVDAETKGSYITIAGQTAPSPGITIANETIYFQRNAHDILVQHLRFRLGETGSQTFDVMDAANFDRKYRQCDECTGLNTPWTNCTDVGTCNWNVPAQNWTPPYNIVIDHCSFSWAVDENIDSGGDNLTIIDSIISEGLYESIHNEGDHSKGIALNAYYSPGAIAGSQNVILIRNLFIHNWDRNPVIAGGSVVVVNNVMYDFLEAIRLDDHTADQGVIKATIQGNYMIDTDLTSRWIHMWHIDDVNLGSRFYLAPDNYFDSQIQTDPWSVVSEGNDATPVSKKAASAADAIALPDGLFPMSAAAALVHIYTNAGARSNDRDVVDARLIAELVAASGTSALIDVIGMVEGDCTSDGEPMACCTGSGDWYPDPCIPNDEIGWSALAENSQAFTPVGSWNTVAGNGYTNLENQLNGISVEQEADLSVTVGAGGGSVTVGAGAGSVTTN